MQYNTHLFIVSLAVLFCLCDTTNAFTTNLVSPIVDVPQRQKQQLQRVRTATTLSHHSSIYQTTVSEEGRRDFLKQLSTAITGASLSPLLLPQLAYADDNEDDATTIDKVETILKDESELDTAEMDSSDVSISEILAVEISDGDCIATITGSDSTSNNVLYVLI